jgi:carboxyl-terminal processing protease
LVDGYTASAAEMIAGALSSYRRGEMVGSRTFGKGCVQEYFDDRSGVGVLRLTTMVFAMPDGSPLQGVGLLPHVALTLPAPSEREKSLTTTFPAWRGPDVRVASALGGPSWPAHRGRLGACPDEVVCRALRRLGSTPSAHRGAVAAPRRVVR